jgi:hypothetical protein
MFLGLTQMIQIEIMFNFRGSIHGSPGCKSYSFGAEHTLPRVPPPPVIAYYDIKHISCVNLCELWCTTPMITVESYKIFVRPDPLSPLCGAGNFGKIWSACGQREIQYAE